LDLTVGVGPLLDTWVYEPLLERGVLVSAYGCHMWRGLAGWRIALSPRLWDRSGYTRVVRAWAAKSRTDRPGF
jgi:hypothetical protein